jgi:hypothetical protein
MKNIIYIISDYYIILLVKTTDRTDLKNKAQ